MNTITLAGCRPTPLAAYLKALGVLRLVSVRDPGARGWWSDEVFHLRTEMSAEEMERFFLHEYEPTPVLAPWNGGSGFYEKDSKEAIAAIAASGDARFGAYRDCLAAAAVVLGPNDGSASPKGEAKAKLLTRLRAALPDAALDWLDAAVVLAGSEPQYPPMLGSGGNDGRLDFTNNFMQRLLEVCGREGEAEEAETAAWLRLALFGDAAAGLSGSAIGQFSPGQAGGANGSTGFEAGALMNPWDFVLMIEGALPFAAAVARRGADDPYGALSYPFTVRAVGAGSGELGASDGESARGELWMPLWQAPAGYEEIRSLLAEGRVALGRKPARDGLDFVRAVHKLGGYRGIGSFQRYGLLLRNGKAYLATPLERVRIGGEPRTGLLDELDEGDWLAEFRRFTQGQHVAARFIALRHRLEDACFGLTGREPTPQEAQAVLTLLGEIQAGLASSGKGRAEVGPVPRLSEAWVRAADDGTPAFRIVRALAGLHGVEDVALPLRAQLFPVHPRWPKWKADADADKRVGKDPYRGLRLHTGAAGGLVPVLGETLGRRLWLAQKLEMKDKPLQSAAGARLDDVAWFLESGAMDGRISALLPGLSLCAIPADEDRSDSGGAVPAAYALLKLCLTPDAILRSLGLLPEGETLPVPPGMLARLGSGHEAGSAVRLAWRRLRASGLKPVFRGDCLAALDGADARRVAAALLIPLRYGAYGKLARRMVQPGKLDTDSEMGREIAI